MRHKLRLFNLILIVVFIFSFTACTIPKTVTETITAETTIIETTASETTAKDKIAFVWTRLLSLSKDIFIPELSF